MKLSDWVAAKRGRQASLADQLGLRQPQVADWISGKKRVPLDHCPFIQAFTAGEVRCEDLRPDAAEYFALIRAQAAGVVQPAVGASPVLPAASRAQQPSTHPGACADRRNPDRASPYIDTDIHRRAAVSTTGEN